MRVFQLQQYLIPLVALTICSASVFGQTNEGTIAGIVLDPTGAAVEGAQIKAKNAGTGTTVTATAGTDGAFRLSSLPIGRYDITVSASGFSTVTQSGVAVQINSTTSVTINLQVGEASQTVTVQAEATRIEADSSDIGTVISTKQVIELPLALGGVGALRSPEAFVFLAPGTSGPGTANSNNGIFISKIGGGQNFGNEILLDGASTLRTENGSSFDEAAPSVEAIQEFKVLSATFPATYGRTTGGIESFTTKSGTNSFHGTAYDIFRNDALDANTWFNNGFAARCAPGDQTCRQPYARPKDKKNDYGVNLGGPLWIPKLYNGKNKTFFFFNWEQYRQNNGGTQTSIVPTAAERTGDFSGILTSQVIGTNPCDGSNVLQGEIFDPNTSRTGPNGVPCRTPFPGNVIPASRFSRVSGNFLPYLPTPNAVGANGINYALSSAQPLFNTTYTVRIDHNFSDKSRMFAMYDTRDNARYAGSTLVFPAPADSGGWNQDFITHYGRAGWDYIFSPTLLNHLNIGYNRTNSQNYTTGAVQARTQSFDWGTRLGLANVSGTNFPIITMGEGIPDMGRANNDANVDNGERLNDYVTWVKGKHNLTFGGDARNQLYSTYAYDTDTGHYFFSRNQTAAAQTLNGTSGNGFASFLLGQLNEGQRYVIGHVARWTSQYYGLFIQDDWKVSSRLTLNLGLRWDLEVPRKESKNLTSNLNLNLPNPGAGNLAGAMQFGSTCGNCNPRWADTYYKDFGPRIGFAYSAGSKMVIRGGWGIYYSPLQYTDFGGEQVQGISATPDFNTPNGFTPAFNWDNGFPAFPSPPTFDPTIKNGQPHADYIDPSFGRPGLIQSWSLQVQEQVSKDMVATLGYVGQRSTHLRSALMNINNINPVNFARGDVLGENLAGNTAGVAVPYAGIFTDFSPTVTVQQALRPFPQYQYIYTDVLQNIGQASYHSLQATLERRFSAGLSLQASFTWSKILTDADSILPGINGGIAQIQNPFNLRDEKALSSQDVPYVFTTAFLYELPFGRGKSLFNHGIGSALLGGWQIGGVLRYQKGVPTSFGCANGVPGWDNCIRFNRVAGQSIMNPSVAAGNFDPFTQRYFNRAAFSDPNAQALRQARGGVYYFGNYPRNSGDARAPNYYNEDFSIIRNFKLYESVVLQLKGEMLNAFNRHIFSLPDANPNDANFGLVNNTIDAPRAVQFTLRVNF